MLINLLLILSFLLYQAPIQVNKTVYIVFVEPAGEVFTKDEQQIVTQHTQAAITFWNTLSPRKTQLTLATDTEFITTTEDVLSYPGLLEYMGNKIRISDAATYVYAIDNSTSNRFLIDDNHVGFSDFYSIWITTRTVVSTYAHELGHHLYNLPHQENQIDIMSLAPQTAYDRNTIGCGSIKELGGTCYQVNIPIIRR